MDPNNMKHSGNSSVVERCLAKAEAEGWIPLFRPPISSNSSVEHMAVNH